MTLYEQVISLLQEAYSNEKFAGIRSRFANEGNEAEEVKAAKRAAQACWFKAKAIYCTNKDELDTSFRENPNEYFNSMVRVIEEEAQETVEKEILQ